jgi:hypothetical protein
LDELRKIRIKSGFASLGEVAEWLNAAVLKFEMSVKPHKHADSRTGSR